MKIERNDELRNRAERKRNHSEMTNRPPKPRDFKEMFDSQMAQMHALRCETHVNGPDGAPLIRSIGSTWFIDPRYGRGHCWHAAIGEQTVVASMDIEFNANIELKTYTTPFICMGLYAKDMPSYFMNRRNDCGEMALGHIWKSKVFRQSVKAGDRLASTSITLGSSSVRSYAKLLRCTPDDIIDAVASLNGTKRMRALSSAFESIERARPDKQRGELFYRAKIVEILTLILDCPEENRRSRYEIVPPTETNQEEIGRLCSYIQGNLDTDLTTKTLSSMLYVNEKKLIEAFKKATGDTPQSYIRKARINAARRLLLSRKDLSIKEIAERVGYPNQGSFSDMFRSETGYSPSEFRKTP